MSIIKNSLSSWARVSFFCLLVNQVGIAVAGGKPITIPEVRLAPKKSIQTKIHDNMQTTHFSRAEITKSPVAELTSFLNQEQSVVRLTHNSGDNSQTAVSIRGFGDNASANSLILVDGFPLTNPSLLPANLNAILLSDIERIDIFQGSQGSLWGDQAVGGVMHIITKHPKMRKPYANILFGVGNNHKKVTSIAAGDQFANGVFLKTYLSWDATDNYRAHNQQSSNNLFLQIGKEYEDGSTRINVQQYRYRINLPGGLNEAQYRADPYQASTYINFADYVTRAMQVLNQQTINSDWLLETRFMHHETDSDGYIYATINRSDATTRLHPRLIGHVHNSKVQLGYELQRGEYSLTRNQVTSGANLLQQHFYLQLVHPINETVDVTLGGRIANQVNHISPATQQSAHSIDRVFVTEQGIKWRVTPLLSFFLRRDGNMSFPKANEQVLVPSNVQALHVQQGVSYETGMLWQGEQHRTGLNLYRLNLQDEIAFNAEQTSLQPLGAFTNLDKTKRFGVSATQFSYLTNKLTLDSQLNYVDARFAKGDNSGKVIPAVPAITGNLNLNYDFIPNWQVKYALHYAGSRYASQDVENVGKQVPAYWLHDVALSYSINRVIVSFDVGNVFNKVYSAYTYYNAETHANTYYPGAGRSYLLTLKINLDT